MHLVSRCALVCLMAAPVLAGGGGWVTFVNQTASRLVSDPDVGISDVDEKDYAVGDVDKDGDLDIICVRKQPWTTTGRRRNVLFMQEGTAEGHAIDGVFVDRTADYVTDADDGGNGFLDLTNDRDVILVDVNDDQWLDMVTATTLSDGLPKTISHPRIYINQGEAQGTGAWLGFRYEQARTPQLFTRPGNLAVAPRFCSVAAGDVTGDGAPDLYFGDYDSSGDGGVQQPPELDLNDRLLVNDGNGFFTDSGDSRMSDAMLESAFAMAVAIEDMNLDGVLDVVKDSALNVPQRVSVSYNDPADEGFFDVLDVIYDDAPYHITVDDLNEDGWLDVVVTDDGTDRYLLNQGVGADGLANFLSFSFGIQDGFGGNSAVADLNNDGHKDVIITDVDVDIAGCTRRMHIYRNLGNVPNVTLQEQGGAQPWTPNGTHDVAVLDINGDGWMDLFIGTCIGTEIWINVPPSGLQFTYPQGLPAFVPPGAPFTLPVHVVGIGQEDPVPGTGVLHLSVDGAPFVDIPMTQLVDNEYEATFPTASCPGEFRFYITADAVGGETFTDPPLGQADPYVAKVAAGTEFLSRDDMEDDVSGWTVTNDPSLTSGAWEQANPNGTVFNGQIAAPEDDATAGASNVQAFVTENGLPGIIAQASDVDGGPTYLTSPDIDLNNADAVISYARWFFCDDSGANADALDVEVSNTGGAPWTLVESVTTTNQNWELANFVVSEYVTPTSSVRVRFSVSDSPNNSVTEAGIDNFQIDLIVCSVCTVDAECDDGNPCTENTCDAGVCRALPLRDPCDDGNPCTVNDACVVGECTGTVIAGCVPCQSDGDCNDGNACTSDTCPVDVCSFVQNTDPCDDGNDCTENDTCTNGSCVGSISPSCDCAFNEDCDDALFCNGLETCEAGFCVDNAPPCFNQLCDEANDVCQVVLQPRTGDPVLGLTGAELDRFIQGRTQFNRTLTESQGLGPVFNQNSCASCHNAGGSGGAGTIVVTRFGNADKGGFDPLASLGGSLLQSEAINDTCKEFLPPEATSIANRITPPIFGDGLIEAIPESAILDRALNPPPGINGLAHMVPALEDPNGSPLRVGRFGWKAQVPTLLTFSGDASLNEMGLTNRLVGQENAPNGDQILLAACDGVADPEDSTTLGNGVEFIDRVTDFQRLLAQPPQTPRSGMSGEALFISMGCADCHAPSYVTGAAPEAALSSKLIKPYSDFLLHNMGLLGDGIVQGDATEQFMRTPPLWGLRHRDALLHDGRATGGTFSERVTAAIAQHNVLGSEAAPSAVAFAALPKVDKDAIVAFLDSLGRADFDHDGNNSITESDFGVLAACYLDAGASYTPDDPCSISDIDQDGDVDDDDYGMFLLAFDGTPADCNGNGAIDFRDILDGASPDSDNNGLLDQCGAPTVDAAGTHTIFVTPKTGPELIALRVFTPDYPCQPAYVDATGTLVTDPVFQTTAAWGTTKIFDFNVIPDAHYEIQAEFQTGSRTPIAAGRNAWGDMDRDGDADFADITMLVDLFKGIDVNLAVEVADLSPCTPDGQADFRDITSDVEAFKGTTYVETGCPLPCQ